jgi:peptide/nickel transport system substrate-binding protein
VTPIPDADSRVLALENGDVDFARQVPGKDAQQLDGNQDLRLLETKASAWGEVYINNSQEPWDNPAVRRAVAHVVNREAIVEAGLFGFGDPAWQPYPESSFWHVDNEEARRERDVEQAQQILDEAGNPLADTTLELKTTGAYPIMESTIEVLAENLNQAGIDAEINKLEWGTMLNDFLEGNFGAMGFSVPFKIDPDRHYYNFIHPSTNQWNKYGEDQPDAQRMYDLVQQGRTETDQDARVEIYTEFQKLVNKNVPWISVARTDDLVGLRSSVRGNQSWLLPYTRYWTMWKSD